MGLAGRAKLEKAYMYPDPGMGRVGIYKTVRDVGPRLKEAHI